MNGTQLPRLDNLVMNATQLPRLDNLVMNGPQLPRLDNLENYFLSDKLWVSNLF